MIAVMALSAGCSAGGSCAAHCINGGKGGGYNTDIVFIPGYHDGIAPYGVWTPDKLIVDPRWARSSDPDFDVGFVVLQPDDGKNIEDVLGADQIGYQAGGDTDSISYSVYLNGGIRDLYRRAAALG
ncbi:MAG TPA: hypothetical protein VFE59_12905 [Trebonia sp.]|nr:hypothetical protein [Trebonia sp.]